MNQDHIIILNNIQC